MRKESEGRKVTTVYLPAELHKLARDRGLNLSQLLADAIRRAAGEAVEKETLIQRAKQLEEELEKIQRRLEEIRRQEEEERKREKAKREKLKALAVQYTDMLKRGVEEKERILWTIRMAGAVGMPHSQFVGVLEELAKETGEQRRKKEGEEEK